MLDKIYESVKNLNENQINEVLTTLNILNPAAKMELAGKILYFMENSIIENKFLQTIGAAWTAEDIAVTKSKLAQAREQAKAQLLGINPDFENGTEWAVTQENMRKAGLAQANLVSEDEGGLILWNPWLTRILKAMAVVGIAVLCYILYRNADVLSEGVSTLKEKIATFIPSLGSVFGTVLPSKEGEARYPFERGGSYSQRGIEDYAVVKAWGDSVGKDAEEILALISAIRNIDIQAVQGFLDVKRRVDAVGKGNRDNRAIAFIGR